MTHATKPRISDARVNTDAAFEELSWHDCHIWGIAVRVGEMSDGDFTSELVLDLDFIVEWLCSPGSLARFRVAPAELVFHDVSELYVSADWREQVSDPTSSCPSAPRRSTTSSARRGRTRTAGLGPST